MKRILILAFAAATILSSCSKGEDASEGPVLQDKTLEFTLSVSKASSSSKMSDNTVDAAGVAAAVRAAITKVELEYYNATGSYISSYTFTQAQIDVLKNDDQAGTRVPVTIKDIPGATAKVNVRLNKATSPDINDLQIPYTGMEYYGFNTTSQQFEPKEITLKSAPTSSSNALYEVEVAVKPIMSRFELQNGLPTIVANGDAPANELNKTEAEATVKFNASVVGVAKRGALLAWRSSKGITVEAGAAADAAYAADPTAALADPTHKQAFPASYDPAADYSFNYVYTNNPYKAIDAIEGYYMNNIPLTKDGVLVLNANDGAGNWDATALARYNSTTGSMKSMFDVTVPTNPNRIVYNLFPQTFTPSGFSPLVDQIKANMPHFIMKVQVTDRNNIQSSKWITIRAFRQTGGNLIDKFEAGKVYILDPASLGLSSYISSLQAVLDGIPGNPGGGGGPDTDPEMENKDLEILVTILDWTKVAVSPEW